MRRKDLCATAHVTQDWELDDSGTFVRCLNDCVEVTHEPDREDVWDCKTCGYSDAGEKFVTTVGEDSEIRLCECVYDLSALAAQMLGSDCGEIDSRDLFHHILNWSREFEEGGFEHEDYMTAVIEFGKLKIAEYKEGLAQSLEAEEAEEPEARSDGCRIDLCVGVRSSRRPRGDLPAVRGNRHQPRGCRYDGR